MVDGTLADKNGMEILLNEEVQNETVLFGMFTDETRGLIKEVKGCTRLSA